MKTGLVLEGGGMRGLYTGGVLDCFLDEGVTTDYLVGVSAGACNSCSYLSGQRGRNKRINTGYLNDSRYLSLKNFVKYGSIFGMDFLFDEIPNRLDPFDFDAFYNSGVELVVGVTDAETAGTVYFDNKSMKDILTILRASSSLPGFAPVVSYNGREYLDGGTTDPIPINRALKDGCDRLIVVLTRDAGYIKTADKNFFIYKRLLKKYPNLIEAIKIRHINYNKTRERLAVMEHDGKAVVIMPSKPLPVGRFTKSLPKLEQTYELGYADAMAMIPRIKSYLQRE